MKKRLLGFIFALTILLSFTACGKVAKAETTTAETEYHTAEPNINDSADDMVIGNVTGNVVSLENDKITLKVKDEQISFEIGSKTSLKGNIEENKPATVYFMGNISKTDKLTLAEIITGDIGSDGFADAVIEEDAPDYVYATVSGRADEILAGMSLEEKIGQMFLLSNNCRDNTEQLISDYHIGGLVMLAPDFEYENKATVREKISALQEKSDIGLFIATEEEGGAVNSISRFSQFRAVPFWSAQDLYSEGGFGYIETISIEKAALLNSLGINLNLSPVCNVIDNKDSAFFKRSLGQSPQITADFVSTVVATFKEHNVATAVKYFPGYDGNGDEAAQIITDNREYEAFEQSDFAPFKAAIRKGTEFIMLSHNIVTCIDGENPASLSPAVNEVLRTELGFAGIAVTDDLSKLPDYEESKGETAVKAVKAGNDMLYTCSCEEEIEAIVKAVNSGDIPLDNIDISVLRILNAKLRLRIIE
ncbi:MAG: glycoside hydrolase family 3 N-terminal domain-containing protein [Ruminiclostridium sp.]